MKLIFLVFSVILLSACAETKYVDRVVYVYPDKNWTIPVPAAEPPDKAAFEKAVIEQRLKMLGDAYLLQSQQLGKCNANLITIDQWRIDHQSNQK